MYRVRSEASSAVAHRIHRTSFTHALEQAAIIGGYGVQVSATRSSVVPCFADADCHFVGLTLSSSEHRWYVSARGGWSIVLDLTGEPAPSIEAMTVGVQSASGGEIQSPVDVESFRPLRLAEALSAATRAALHYLGSGCGQ